MHGRAPWVDARATDSATGWARVSTVRTIEWAGCGLLTGGVSGRLMSATELRVVMRLQPQSALLLLLVVAPPDRPGGGLSHPRHLLATREPGRVGVNDNRRAAGSLHGGVWRLHLEARLGMWYPDGDSASGALAPAFA